MSKGILGRKVGMTQIFDHETGEIRPVTVIQAGPCHVLQVKTVDKDGYAAIQLGFLDKKRPLKDKRSRPSQASRSERGHVASIGSKRSKARAAAGVTVAPKANCEPKQFVRELRGSFEGYEVGKELRVDELNSVKAVDVVGITKGRGYSGVMKRHGFKGQRATHGVKKVHRHPGGTGALAAWRGGGRMKKGKKMAGQYGSEQVTARNLRLVRVDLDDNLLLIGGAVPGPNGAFVVVRETNMKR
jgi:large subunit ribosomal protein L3